MTDTVKIKITPNAASASTSDKPDVAQLLFSDNGINSTHLLYINGEQVMWQNQYSKFNDSTGEIQSNSINSNESTVKGSDVIVESEDLKVESGSVLVKDLKANGSEVLLASPSLSWDEATQTLTVKNLKVLENIVVSGNRSIIELCNH